MTASVFALALLSLASSALAAEAGPYAPENIVATEHGYAWQCMIRALCPVNDKMRDIIKRSIANDRSAEYLLGLTLVLGDELPRDKSAGVAWIVRAAELGEPAGARDIARRLRNGEAVEVDETKVAAALSRRRTPAIPRQCARSDRCISADAA
jgi:TPR repeat protein